MESRASVGPALPSAATCSPAGTSWSSIYADNVDWVYRAIYGQVGNRPDAEDATADVFMRALPLLRPTASSSQVRAYLAATVRSVVADHWRERFGVGLSAASELVAPPSDGEVVSVTEVNSRRATRLLARLPARYRRVLELRFLEGYSLRETAKVLDISVTTAKVLQHRALKRAAELGSND